MYILSMYLHWNLFFESKCRQAAMGCERMGSIYILYVYIIYIYIHVLQDKNLRVTIPDIPEKKALEPWAMHIRDVPPQSDFI